MCIRKILVSGLALLCTLTASAQTEATAPGRDTLAIYKKIKKVAYKRRFTRFLFHTIFLDPSPPSYPEQPLSDDQKTQDPNLYYSGKVIRSITVDVHDPFGFSVNDTLGRNVNYIQRIGNRYHITTHRYIVRNLVLFRINDTVDVVKLSESERLLRSADFVNDARIFLEEVPGTDSVNVRIIVQDKWTLGVAGAVNQTSGNIDLEENNMFGSGQRYRQVVKYSLLTGWEFNGRYSVPNISRTYISSTIFYQARPDAGYAGFSFDRPFFSALTRWAGGVAGSRVWDNYSYYDTLQKNAKAYPLNYVNTDTWVGRSIHTRANKWVNKKVSNIVAAVRFAETHYDERPAAAIDTLHLFYDQRLYLASLGFSLSKYYKDRYIFRFGANEDIPEGMLLQVVGGFMNREFTGKRYYSGISFSKGKHFDHFGYLSFDAVYGTFFFRNSPNDATLDLGLTYFTDLLLTARKWYFRGFTYIKYVYGTNKTSLERITIRSDELYGFRSGSLTGFTKAMLNLEAVAYAPYNILGFRFAPVLLAGIGKLGSDNQTLVDSRTFQSYALGLLIRNESLVNSSFRITFGFYPNLPEGEENWYRYNPVTTFTVRIKSFSVSRPELVPYN
jgi:hypothetical protein